jgi:hypothetical protein
MTEKSMRPAEYLSPPRIIPSNQTDGTAAPPFIVSRSSGQLATDLFAVTGLPVFFAQATPAKSSLEINELFDNLRSYAREHNKSVLELIAEHALADLPINIGRMIRNYLEERKPKVKPGEVKYTGLFSSGRSDLSERMEEIIYNLDQGDDE